MFQSEADLYDAVVSENETLIAQAGSQVKAEKYRNANARLQPVDLCQDHPNVPRTSCRSNGAALEAELDHLHSGIVGDEPYIQARTELNDFGQDG